LTSTPAPSITPTITPFPMEIRALRAGFYPGSDISIEEELDPGANYRRYYASYLSEGLKIFALLTIPNGEMPKGGWPAIVFNHGYIPPDQYRTTERYIAYVDRLAGSGYIVFRIDYRGNDRSESTPSGAYGNPGYLKDVLNAVSSLKRFPQTNPEKIGMWGHSMGGYLTLRAMVISKAVKAGVIWGGVVGSYPDLLNNWHTSRSDLNPTLQPGSTRWRESWVKLYGTPENNPEFWDSVSANTFLADLSGPIQLHHSMADEEVPVEFSQTLFKQIKSVGREAELFTYENDNHNISNNFTTAMTRTIAFFDRILK
jgi:dipeptidyl aminopeptidase/acylaminoacyl peptidase